MACKEWEVRDSCAESLGDLYTVLEGSGGEEDILSFFGVHKLVLSAVGDEDHNVRASSLTAVSRLALCQRPGELVTDFCAENGISKVCVWGGGGRYWAVLYVSMYACVCSVCCCQVEFISVAF